MTGELRLDPAALRQVADDLTTTGDRVRATVDELAKALAREGNFWGDDEVGRSFARDYVPATAQSLHAIRSTAEFLRDTGIGLRAATTALTTGDRVVAGQLRRAGDPGGPDRIPGDSTGTGAPGNSAYSGAVASLSHRNSESPGAQQNSSDARPTAGRNGLSASTPDLPWNPDHETDSRSEATDNDPDHSIGSPGHLPSPAVPAMPGTAAATGQGRPAAAKQSMPLPAPTPSPGRPIAPPRTVTPSAATDPARGGGPPRAIGPARARDQARQARRDRPTVPAELAPDPRHSVTTPPPVDKPPPTPWTSRRPDARESSATRLPCP